MFVRNLIFVNILSQDYLIITLRDSVQCSLLKTVFIELIEYVDSISKSIYVSGNVKKFPYFTVMKQFDDIQRDK